MHDLTSVTYQFRSTPSRRAADDFSVASHLGVEPVFIQNVEWDKQAIPRGYLGDIGVPVP